jgi:hypothetical protein
MVVPLPSFDMSEFVAWNLTKNRHILTPLGLLRRMGQPIRLQNIKFTWNWIDKTTSYVGHNLESAGSAKVKKMIWRIMQESIPCRVTLTNRHIKVSPQCPVCELGLEYVKHLLFICLRAKLVWKSMGQDLVIDHACKVDRAG